MFKKLLRRDRKPGHETATPSAVPAAPVLQLVIISNTDLPEQQFNAQREALRRVAYYDNTTRSWHNQVPLDRPERAAEMLSTLFEAARLHGTTIWVHIEPAGEGSLSSRRPGNHDHHWRAAERRRI